MCTNGLPQSRWYYNMRTVLLTVCSILCLCWESNTSLWRVFLSQNCQMATPPFMWKQSWSLLRISAQCYILFSACAKWHLITLRLMLSSDYHWEHVVKTSIRNYYSSVGHCKPHPGFEDVSDCLAYISATCNGMFRHSDIVIKPREALYSPH